MPFTFATRPSALARWQTARVIQLLQAAHPGLEIFENVITTREEPENTQSLGKGLFTGGIEEALFSGQAQAALYSLKDLPLKNMPGLEIAAIPERESAYDVLVTAKGQTLSELHRGARIGTSSIRRAAQILACRPDLTILPLRGNVDTRVRSVLSGEYDAIVLAQAGLTRLGLEEYISEILSLDVMLPAPGQGALAVQCRADDQSTLQLLAAIHDPITAAAVDAERAFVAGLGGGCSLPAAAFAQNYDGNIILTGAVISPDGKKAIRLSAVDQDPQMLGHRLADLVLERGASEFLNATV